MVGYGHLMIPLQVMMISYAWRLIVVVLIVFMLLPLDGTAVDQCDEDGTESDALLDM